MSEGYSSLRAQWESRMKESEAQSALAAASSPGAAGEKTKSSSTSVPPWKRSAQAAAAAKAKEKEAEEAGAATTPSWTRPSLTVHHAAETVEKYVASPSSTDDASPTAAAAGGGGEGRAQAEIVEEHSLSVSAAKSMFGGSVTKSKRSYGGGTGASVNSGANSNDRAARWRAEAAVASAGVDDSKVEEDRITSVTVSDAKRMFGRPSPSAADSGSGSPSSRPKWLSGGGISDSPPSAAATGSGVPEAYAELFGVTHEYDKDKGTALGASGMIAEDEEEESEGSASANGGDVDGGRPAWLQGQRESGDEIAEIKDTTQPDRKALSSENFVDGNDDVANDAPVVPEPAAADWLQVEDQDEDRPPDQDDEIAKEEEKEQVDEPPPKKLGWGTNLMKWLERKESESGSGSEGSAESDGKPESVPEESPIQEEENIGSTGAYKNDDAIDPSEEDEEMRRKRAEEEEAILAMLEAENQRYAQDQRSAAHHLATHEVGEGEGEGTEAMGMATFDRQGGSDEDSESQDPSNTLASAAAGVAIAGAGIAVATAATSNAPVAEEPAPIDFSSAPMPPVESEEEPSDADNFDDYAAGGHDESEYYSEEETDYAEQVGKASSSVPSAREMSDEDYADEEYDEDMVDGAGSYSERATEGLEANLSSAYGLGAADDDAYYHDQEGYDQDDYMEDLDDDTIDKGEEESHGEGDAYRSYTTIDRLEDEFLTETGERSSQSEAIEDDGSVVSDDIGRARPVLLPEDSELSLDNTTMADERARLRQELEMELLQEEEEEGPSVGDDDKVIGSDRPDMLGASEADRSSPNFASAEGFEAESLSSDDEIEEDTALKAAAIGLAAAAVAGGTTAGVVAATRASDDIPPPPDLSTDQLDHETDYAYDGPFAGASPEIGVYPAATSVADEAFDDYVDEEIIEEEPAEFDESQSFDQAEGTTEAEAKAEADDIYYNENATYPEGDRGEYVHGDAAADYPDEGGLQGGEEEWGDEENYVDDYALYPHPSTDDNNDMAGDKLYDYEDVDSGYSNKQEADDFSDGELGHQGGEGQQEGQEYEETRPDDRPPMNQEESLQSLDSEALNTRAMLMREELSNEIDQEKQGGGTEEGHASAESYDYYNEPESKSELKARIDSIHSEVVVDEDEGVDREVVTAAGVAVSAGDGRDKDSHAEETLEEEDDDSSGYGREMMAGAGAAALAAAATAGGIAAADANSNTSPDQTPPAAAATEDEYALRTSVLSHGEETHLTWGESDLNAPEPPVENSEEAQIAGSYPEEKEEEGYDEYDEYGDYYDNGADDYNDGNVVAVDMAAPIDFSNPPEAPSDDHYDDYGPNNDDYYQDQTEEDGCYQERGYQGQAEEDGYYQEGDYQEGDYQQDDDYYHSNEYSQDQHVAEGDDRNESGQDQGVFDEEEEQDNKAAYAAGGVIAAAALGGGIAAAAATGAGGDSPTNPATPATGTDKEPGDYGPKARSPSIRLKKSLVVEQQSPRERLSMDAIAEAESFPEVERDIELGYADTFQPGEHLQDSSTLPNVPVRASATKSVSWDKDIDRDRPNYTKKWCILAMVVVVLSGIAVGLSFSLTKRNKSSSDTAQDSPPAASPGPEDSSSSSTPQVEDPAQPGILFAQVGETIAGPSRIFEYGIGTNGKFGASLSLSGDGGRVAIGAPNYSASIFSKGERLGLVQVFEQLNGTWTKLEPDIFGDLSGDATGTSVSLSSDGTTLAVGSPEHLNAIFGGQVILYQFSDDGVWQQLGSPIIGDDAFDRLGTSVSLNDGGDRVAISQPTDKPGGAARKVAKVYELQDNDWVQLGDDLVGRAGSDPVSMSGNGQVVALGSLSRTENNNRAAVRIYHYANNTSTNETVGWKLKGPEIELKGAKGSYDTLWMPSLSADGNTVAIGSAIENFNKTENPNEQHELQVLAYRYDEEFGNWTEIPVNTNLEMQGLHLLQYSTSLSGDGQVLVVGDSGAGLVEVLHLTDKDGAYIPVEGNVELKGVEGSDDLFGYSVAVSSDGKKLASGAPQSVVAGEEVGSVSVFEMSAVEGER